MLGGQLSIGALMVVLTVVVHTVGVIALTAYLRERDLKVVRYRNYVALTRVLVFTTLVIFLLHTVEIWLWALLYIWLDEFQTIERALYFSTVVFTTLGYGDIILGPRWQLLSSFEAANGLLLIGVSTAYLFAVIKKLFAISDVIKPD